MSSGTPNNNVTGDLHAATALVSSTAPLKSMAIHPPQLETVDSASKTARPLVSVGTGAASSSSTVPSVAVSSTISTVSELEHRQDLSLIHI